MYTADNLAQVLVTSHVYVTILILTYCYRYCPILPMVLINGAAGIGTGWSTNVPNFDIRDVAENIKRLVANEDLLPMVSWSSSSIYTEHCVMLFCTI